MKILIITRDRSGRGGHVVVVNLVKELRKRGHEVDFVAFKPEGEDDFPDGAKLWHNSKVILVSIKFFADTNEQTREYIDAATEYLKDNRTKYAKIILDSWFCLIAGIKANIIDENIYHLAQSSPIFEPEDSIKIWKALLFELLPFYPVKRITVSRTDSRFYLERYSQISDLMPLYIDEAYHKADFNVVDHSPIKLISSAGDFNIPDKGLDFLLDSLKNFSAFPFTLTLLAGRPIEKELVNYSFPIEVVSASTPIEMREILLSHDIYLNASRKESFCFALAEAIAIGMPAVALDSVGNRDYAQKDNYIWVEKDSEFLRELACLKDIEKRKKLSIKAKKSMQKYTLDHTIDELEKILELS